MTMATQGPSIRPSKVDALIPISARMPQGIPLKFSLLPKIPLFMHVIRLVVPRASKIESDGPGFCNCTMQQSLFVALDSVPG